MVARRAATALVTASVAAVLAMASVAFACTNFIRIDSIAAATEAPSPTAAIRGSGAAAGATVELRWNSPKGPLIGTATATEAGDYATSVSIPQASAGIHMIVASDGKTVNRAAYAVGDPRAVLDPTTPLGRTEGKGAALPSHSILAAVSLVGLVILLGGFAAAAVRARPASLSTARQR